MNWNWSVTHVVAEAEVRGAVGSVCSFSGLGKELCPVLLNLVVKLCQNLCLTAFVKADVKLSQRKE